ncbi:glycosyltransferase family 2 protein [Halobellus sp. Atlit-31R]|nr:glycosyltransferase family 2 protein [Halobellus sp. Atlit-31R]
MYEKNTVGVVVPAYNEEGFVGEVIETLPSFVDRAYVIDDCSTDGTWGEIRAAAERVNADVDADAPYQDRVSPLQHDHNRGVGGAIKTGYKHALADGIDVVAVMGGDGQMRPEDLPCYLDPIVAGEADYTKGNRLLNREFRRGMPSWRLFGNWILTFLTKVASGYWRTMDPQNGYTAISKEALEAIDVDRMYEGYGYCNDLLVRLNVAGLRVGDVPRAANYGDETSSIRYHTYIPRVSAMLLRDFLWRLRVKYLVRRFHPLALLYGIGSVTTSVGAVSLLRSILRRRSESGSNAGRTLSSALLLVVGWIGLVLAMVFDLRENADLERQFEE